MTFSVIPIMRSFLLFSRSASLQSTCIPFLWINEGFFEYDFRVVLICLAEELIICCIAHSPLFIHFPSRCALCTPSNIVCEQIFHNWNRNIKCSIRLTAETVPFHGWLTFVLVSRIPNCHHFHLFNYHYFNYHYFNWIGIDFFFPPMDTQGHILCAVLLMQ